MQPLQCLFGQLPVDGGSVTAANMEDLTPVSLSELHSVLAYLRSQVVRERPPDLAMYCKAWPVRNGDRIPRTAIFFLGFFVDFSRMSNQPGALRSRSGRPAKWPDIFINKGERGVPWLQPWGGSAASFA